MVKMLITLGMIGDARVLLAPVSNGVGLEYNAGLRSDLLPRCPRETFWHTDYWRKSGLFLIYVHGELQGRGRPMIQCAQDHWAGKTDACNVY